MSYLSVKSTALFLLLCIPLTLLAAEPFWSAAEVAEVDGFSEMEGIVKLSFKDAVNGKPVKGITLTKENKQFQGDDFGVVTFPMSDIEGLTDKEIPVTVSAPGYITLEDNLKIVVGTLFNKRFVMSRETPANQARLVLEWDKAPVDLDAVLQGPGFTVSYRSMKNATGNASLDRDCRAGYGPETITLLNIASSGEYLFSVQNYSKEAPMKNVKATLYVNNRIFKVIWIIKTGSNNLDLFRIRNSKAEVMVSEQ